MHPACVRELKRAVNLLEMNWEAQLYHGKINPVTGIFIGKNQFNYSDRLEHLVIPRYEDTGMYTAEALRERYFQSENDHISTTINEDSQ